VQEYLIKPYTIDELEGAIQRVDQKVQLSRKKLAQVDDLKRKKEDYLKQLANEYSKARRTDDKAMEVFEQLADYPNCEARWLQTLAMIYVVRQEWSRLKILAAKLEFQTKK